MKVQNMSDIQRKVYEACRNGWFLGGEYRAKFDNHERKFFADSPRWLFHEVGDWLESHAEHHANANLLVKFNA